MPTVAWLLTAHAEWKEFGWESCWPPTLFAWCLVKGEETAAVFPQPVLVMGQVLELLTKVLEQALVVVEEVVLVVAEERVLVVAGLESVTLKLVEVLVGLLLLEVLEELVGVVEVG